MVSFKPAIKYSIAFFGSLQLILNKVLLLGSPSQTIVGRPIVPDGAVHAVVEEHVSAELPVRNKFDMQNQLSNFEIRNGIALE